MKGAPAQTAKGTIHGDTFLCQGVLGAQQQQEWANKNSTEWGVWCFLTSFVAENKVAVTFAYPLDLGDPDFNGHL